MTPAGKNIFLSYSRADQETVQPLIDGLRRLRYEMWLDQELSGGQEWWNTILEHLRNCDAMLLAVSEKALESQACLSEFEYAKALNKPILPVMVNRVRPTLLWPGLFELQLVDYTVEARKAAFDLMAALDRLPAIAALPTPLPEPPRVPISYLNDLSRMVRAPTLNLDEQMSVLGRLKSGLERPEERELVLQLLRKLRDRNDLFHATAVQIDDVLTATTQSEEKLPTPLVPRDEGAKLNAGVGEVSAPTTIGSVGTLSTDRLWRWDGTNWVPAQPSQKAAMPRAKTPMGGLEIATVLLLAFCPPVGLVTVWLTRWSMPTKVIIASVVGVFYLVIAIVAIPPSR